MSVRAGITLESRVAKMSDAERLVEVVQLAYRGGVSSVAWKNENHLVAGPRVTLEQMKETIDKSGSTLLVAKTPAGNEPEEILGCILIEEHGIDVHIGMFAVDPVRQNMGIGKFLVRAAEKYAAETIKAKFAKMYVFTGRPELLAWYTSLGYAETGETSAFPGPEAGVTPLVDNLHFIEIAKPLVVTEVEQ